jgi:RTX calcium-binding nonapeptide repeat (4 copies)
LSRHGCPTIVGTEGNDSIFGTAGPDVIATLGGDDSVVAGAGNDRICTGAGSDAVLAEDGDDSIDAGEGSDGVYYFTATGPVQMNFATGVTTGAAGRDNLLGVENAFGSDFDDTLIGNAEMNVFSGGGGTDRLDGGANSDALDGGAGDDTVSAGGGPDIVFGRGGSDRLDGGADDDKLFGGPGNDVLNGGAGEADSVSYIDSPSGVRADLAAGTSSGGENADRFTKVEGLAGSQVADQLVGDAKPNQLFGNDGNDTISTGAGSDFAGGGEGTDTTDAGAGRDYCLEDQRGRDCEISGAPAIPGAPDAPPIQTTPGPATTPRQSSPQLLAWMARALQRIGSVRLGAALPTVPPLPRRQTSRFPSAVRTTAGYEYSAEPVCITGKSGGVTEIAAPNVVQPVGDDDHREEAWWQATLFRQSANGRFSKRHLKTAWARAQLAGDIVVPGVVVWKDVSGRRAFRSPIKVRVPRGRYVWKGQIYSVRSGGRIFAPVEPHLIRARTIRVDKNCDFR